MRRHTWKTTGQKPDTLDLSAAPDRDIERCAHCLAERVKDKDRKTLFLYRGGKALGPHGARLPQDGRWAAFFAGVIPQCVERT